MHRACLKQKPADIFCMHLCGAGRPVSLTHVLCQFSRYLFFLEAVCTPRDRPPPLPADPQLHLPISHACLCSCRKETSPQLLRLLYSIIHPHDGYARRFGAENQCFGACFCNPAWHQGGCSSAPSTRTHLAPSARSRRAQRRQQKQGKTFF